MKKVLSLLLVLGCVVLFSQIASAAIKGTYTAEVTVGGTFSFVPELKLTSDYSTDATKITWSGVTGAFESLDNWKNADVAIVVDVTNEKVGTTVQLYQDNANNDAGYKNTIGYDLGGGSKSYSGLIRQTSDGAQRFVMGMKVSSLTATGYTTVAPNDLNQEYGFYMKDKSDWNYASTPFYYTILTDQGFLVGISEEGDPQFALLSSGTPLYIHFGANFRDAAAGNYATQTVTLESFNE